MVAEYHRSGGQLSWLHHGFEEARGLFRAHKGIVFRRARAILGDSEGARDVTQEVFLKIMSRSVRLPAERSATG